MSSKRRDTLPKNLRRTGPAATSGQPRRISRREREARRRRQLFWALGIAGGVIVAILVVSSLNQYWFKPRHVLAEVNGVEIRRRDYWKVRSMTLVNQVSQYSNIANNPNLDASQQQQYAQLAQRANDELKDVWGSTDTDPSTLQQMIDDQLFLQNAASMGVTISDQDVQDYIALNFGPFDSPLFTPTPSPTLIPERAAWATGTAVSLDATMTAEAAIPEATPPGSPAASPADTGGATPVDASHAAGSPTAVASPAVAEASPNPETAGSPVIAASPVAQDSPVASPVAPAAATPEITPTLSSDEVRATATVAFGEYKDAVFGRTHMSMADYKRLIVRPAIARQRVTDQIDASIGQTAEQVHAAHILVDTKDLADSIYAEVTKPGANFEEIARNQSNDSATAANGGDLGWFTRGEMVPAFAQVAFSLQPGQISQPVQTEFGWHIIKVYDHQQNRPMTDDQIAKVKQKAVQDWLDQQRAAARIRSDIKPTPTPSLQQFVPPADAPPLPTPTPTPEPTLIPPVVASPVP